MQRLKRKLDGLPKPPVCFARKIPTWIRGEGKGSGGGEEWGERGGWFCVTFLSDISALFLGLIREFAGG